MTANKGASRRSLKSDLARVDAHTVAPEDYDELPDHLKEGLDVHFAGDYDAVFAVAFSQPPAATQNC